MTVRELLDELWGQSLDAEVRFCKDPEGDTDPVNDPVYGIKFMLPEDDRHIVWCAIEVVK